MQKMAGIQLCCRKLLISNTSRFFIRKELLLQPSRKRHHLVFRTSTHTRLLYPKSKLVYYTGRLCTYRLSSTNVTESQTTAINPLNIQPSETESKPVLLSHTPDAVEQSDVVIDENTLPNIPTSYLSEVPDLEFIDTGLKEPSFESLGLGSWWPSGVAQQILEFFHIHLDLPWWGAIALVTVISRILLFPVNIKTRKEMVTFMNHQPEILKFQEKMNEARLRGDYYSAALHSQELQAYIAEKKLNLFPFLRPLLFQSPIFISIYYAFRGMTNLPVESLKTGGLLWFKDLTEPDPYCILPCLLSVSLFLMMELGIEGNPSKTNTPMMKWVMRGLPIIIFFLTMRFSACMTWYWTVSNFIALLLSVLFKISYIKKIFKIPEQKALNYAKKSTSNKGFIKEFREGFSIAKIKSQIEERERMNSDAFQRAGIGPIPRTFKNNPLLKKDKNEQ